MSSSPWIRIIVPFGVRSSTLIILGAWEFFFENPLPVFAANAGIGTKSPPAVNWRNSPESCDYPDYAHPLAFDIEQGVVPCGIAICGTANGISITLNKHQNIRAAVCWIPEIAELARRHNDANVCSLPARFIDNEIAKQCVDKFLATEFEGGRHLRRVEKIPVPQPE